MLSTSGLSSGSSGHRWLPGTSRVPPFSSEWSSSIQAVLTTTRIGNERGVYPWSECSAIGSPPGAAMLAVRLDKV